MIIGTDVFYTQCFKAVNLWLAVCNHSVDRALLNQHWLSCPICQCLSLLMEILPIFCCPCFIALRVLLCRCRFTETKLCSLYRVVKEEISDDNAKLPCFNGRVVSWVGSKYIHEWNLFALFVCFRYLFVTIGLSVSVLQLCSCMYDNDYHLLASDHNYVTKMCYASVC